jgi:hypothetical protein
MDEVCASEMALNFCQTTQSHMPYLWESQIQDEIVILNFCQTAQRHMPYLWESQIQDEIVILRAYEDYYDKTYSLQ